MRKAASLAGLMALALASPIHAHVGIWADSIFSLAHPVGGWGQVLAVLSIGLVSAQGGQRSLRMLLLRVDRIWEGTSEIQRLIIARSLLKRGLDGM